MSSARTSRTTWSTAGLPDGNGGFDADHRAFGPGVRRLVFTLPCRAGESHMDLRSLLHPGATWILRTTPESTGESDGQIQEDFQRIGGPTGSQFPTPDVGGPVHRSGCDAVRGGRSFGHGAVRPFQGRAAAANPSTG